MKTTLFLALDMFFQRKMFFGLGLGVLFFFFSNENYYIVTVFLCEKY